MNDKLMSAVQALVDGNGQEDTEPMTDVGSVIVIPADPNEPVRVEPFHGESSQIRELVGGIAAGSYYDRDATMWVNDDGRNDGEPMNMRATYYIRTESEAAPKMQGVESSYGLYGTVVVTGPSADEIEPAPQRLIEYFDERLPGQEQAAGDQSRDMGAELDIEQDEPEPYYEPPDPDNGPDLSL